MGPHIDGDRDFISIPSGKLLELGWMCIWLLGQKFSGAKPLLMILERFVRSFEFRRPLMGLLNDAWPRGVFFPQASQVLRSTGSGTSPMLFAAACALHLVGW